MPARLPGKGIYATSKGEYNTKKKTFTGKGAAPSGSTKVAEPSYDEVPTVTVSSSGKVTTSGYSSQKAARADRKRAEARTRRKRAVALTKTPRAEKASQRVTPQPVLKQAKAKVTAAKTPKSKPVKFEGKPTAGTPTLKELKTGSKSGTLKVNKKGFVTTAPVRKAARAVKKAKKVVARSQPSTKGLAPEEKAVIPYVRKAHRKYPDIPVSVLMAQIKQESGFQPVNESSAGAEGLSQFIPSTAATYGVKYGAGRREQQSQVTGQAHYLHDLGFAKDPKAAMSGYTGGYSDAEYNDPVLTDAKVSYSALDRPGNPKAVKRLVKAKAEARKVGLKAGKKPGPAGPSRIPSVVYIGHQAEKKFGLHVGENPAFGGVEPVHAEGSFHYQTDSKGRGEAIDVSGDPAKMLAFDHWVAKKWGKGVSELFYDPGISIDEGTVLSSGIGGHEDHVHVAVAMPGEKIGGGVAVGSGGAMFIGYGPTTSAAIASSNNARKAAAKGKGKHQSPYASAWKKLKKLDDLKVGQGTPTTQTKESAPSTSVLEALEAKYGAAA